jgi:hypothetical protein
LLYTATELSGERGGCSCAHVTGGGAPPSGLALLLLLPSLLASALLVAPAPAQAVSSGCSSASDRPGELFVQASYGEDPSMLFRFYVSGPETRTVYEGHEPRSFAETLTGLTPGTYRWMLYREQDGNRGTITLATCTVYGLVDVPSVKGQSKASAQSELEGAGLALGDGSVLRLPRRRPRGQLRRARRHPLRRRCICGVHQRLAQPAHRVRARPLCAVRRHGIELDFFCDRRVVG